MAIESFFVYYKLAETFVVALNSLNSHHKKEEESNLSSCSCLVSFPALLFLFNCYVGHFFQLMLITALGIYF